MGLPQVFLGTLREHYILLFGVAGSFGLVAGFVGAWIGARFGARAALGQNDRTATHGLATQADVGAVTEGLDALLLEVERVAEAQRFVAKLLAERAERVGIHAVPPPRREPGQITPH